MRYEKNDFFVVTTHLLNTRPSSQHAVEFFGPRIANSTIIAIACGAVGEHLIDNRFALSFATLRKAQRQIN